MRPGKIGTQGTKMAGFILATDRIAERDVNEVDNF